MRRVRGWAPDFRAALPGWLVARAIVLAAVVIGHERLDHGYRPHLKVVLAHTGLMSWDADWYRRIAVHGYGGVPRAGLRFFPLYPLVGRVAGIVFAGRTDWGLLVVANGLALVLGALVHRLVLLDFGDRRLARRAAWLVALAPPAFVLVMGYSEPLFLCLVVVAFLAMRARQWWWVAFAGLLAGLTRPVGLLLMVPVALEVAGVGHGRHRPRPAEIPGCVAALVAPLVGMATYLAWVGIRFGDPWLPLRVQSIPGLRGRTVSPLATVQHAASGLLRGHLGQQVHWPWVVVVVALAIVVARRWPVRYSAYAGVTVVAALAAEHLGSFERYAYAAFPLVVAAAALARSQRAERVLLIVSAVAMGAYAVAAFVGAYVP